MNLGGKIRLLRILKGYTQEVMADSLKLSVTGYGKIERDETDITISRLKQIADVLGLKMDSILQSGEKPCVQNYLNSHVNTLDGTSEQLKTLYESRINRLEEEIQEMRKLLFEIIKKSHK